VFGDGVVTLWNWVDGAILVLTQQNALRHARRGPQRRLHDAPLNPASGNTAGGRA
jgi:hypothetical protein